MYAFDIWCTYTALHSSLRLHSWQTYRKGQTSTVNDQRLVDGVQIGVDLVLERLQLIQNIRLRALVDNENLQRREGETRCSDYRVRTQRV